MYLSNILLQLSNIVDVFTQKLTQRTLQISESAKNFIYFVTTYITNIEQDTVANKATYTQT